VRGPGYDPGPGNARFVVEKRGTGQVQVFRSILHPSQYHSNNPPYLSLSYYNSYQQDMRTKP
jgi:hypothetical protein